jgi:hypothetical protein
VARKKGRRDAMVTMRIAIGNIFSWLVTALFGVITVLLAFESWALLTNHRPITDYIRPAVHSYPGYAFVIAVVVGILLGHFLWGPAYGRTSPVVQPK